MRKLVVHTPEGLRLDRELAGPGSRFAAALFDVVVFGLAYAAVLVVVVLITQALEFGGLLPGVMGGVGGAVLLFLAYRFGFHMAWGGQTPGKRLVRLRVTTVDGYPPSALQLALRELLLPVDSMPVPFYVGVLAMLFHPARRRLGDLAASTAVVVDQDATNVAEPFPQRTYEALEHKELALTPGLAARCTADDLEFVRDLLQRNGLMVEHRRRLFVAAARHYAERLDLGDFQDARRFLRELYLYLREAKRAPQV